MKMRRSLAPYPLLAKTNDSYRKSSFDGIAELKASGKELRLEFRAVLRCTSLRNLVRAGLAGYALHVESPVTSYRRLFEFNDALHQRVVQVELDLWMVCIVICHVYLFCYGI